MQADPNNCGKCANACLYPHALGRCTGGLCEQYGCQPGYADLDASVPGCEARCAANGAERCDGLDNDCDGLIDESDPSVGMPCGSDAGVCAGNQWACVMGKLTCSGTAPTAEACDGLDNDCNGVVDDGFDKLNDPLHCGGCSPCSLAHASAKCASGSCQIGSCTVGWVDVNRDAGDGCEASCVFRGAEVCNGVDDDCDGLLDTADPDWVKPSNGCKSLGECAGAAPSCSDAGWICTYTDPDIELAANGTVRPEESRCDGKDNDCDGVVDEVFPAKGGACVEDGTYGTSRRLGRCQGAGQLMCNSAQTGLRCNITVAGATAVSEACNGLDDDCDGRADEPWDFGGFSGVRDSVVGPITVNGQSVIMFRYEASRADATALAQGYSEGRACSVVNRMPWTYVDFAGATAACSAAGMRLCAVIRNGSGQVTSDEWGRFCSGASNLSYPYGNVYSASACNGAEYDPIPGGVNEDVAVPTGTLSTCASQDQSRDQSGNVWEWVNDLLTLGGATATPVRGGSYDSFPDALMCSNQTRIESLTAVSGQLGFRCCQKSCPAGQSECAGACVDLGSSSTNCGACGVVCAGGRFCSNGYCCPTGTRACGDVCVAVATACP